MWTNHEGQGSPVSHGHSVNYNHTTLHNKGVYLSQANPDGNDDPIVTPNSSSSVSGDSHGMSLCSCWVCGMEGTYHKTALKLLVEADVNWTHIHCIPT